MADISFDGISNSLGKATSAAENNMESSLNTISSASAPTTAQLLAFQASLQEWSVTVQVQSTTTKELGDSLKGIIQKAD